MDQLVIVLNARLDAAGGAEGEPKSREIVRYFEDGGEGGFEGGDEEDAGNIGAGNDGNDGCAAGTTLI